MLTPEKPRGDEFLAALRELQPEISVVVAYGHILRDQSFTNSAERPLAFRAWQSGPYRRGLIAG